jgi:hypothetical protein
MKLKIDFFKMNGKWYTGGTVDVPDETRISTLPQAIVTYQQLLVENWNEHVEFMVVVDGTTDDGSFMKACFMPSAFEGLLR